MGLEHLNEARLKIKNVPHSMQNIEDKLNTRFTYTHLKGQGVKTKREDIYTDFIEKDKNKVVNVEEDSFFELEVKIVENQSRTVYYLRNHSHREMGYEIMDHSDKEAVVRTVLSGYPECRGINVDFIKAVGSRMYIWEISKSGYLQNVKCVFMAEHLVREISYRMSMTEAKGLPPPLRQEGLKQSTPKRKPAETPKSETPPVKKPNMTPVPVFSSTPADKIQLKDCVINLNQVKNSGGKANKPEKPMQFQALNQTSNNKQEIPRFRFSNHKPRGAKVTRNPPVTRGRGPNASKAYPATTTSKPKATAVPDNKLSTRASTPGKSSGEVASKLPSPVSTTKMPGIKTIKESKYKALSVFVDKKKDDTKEKGKEIEIIKVSPKRCYHCNSNDHSIKECKKVKIGEKNNKTDAANMAAARASSPVYGSTDIRYRDKAKKVTGKDLKNALKAKNEKNAIRNIKKESK